LVGTDDTVDRQLPDGIISIHRTQNQKELVELYSAADVFVNPTREETYPTVNMEAIACGTPVVTFRTGGSPEIVLEGCGAVTDRNTIDSLEEKINQTLQNRQQMSLSCEKASKSFDEVKCFKEYVELICH
jgi:glycosyltransferase involved in cell wall biosynthesis